ncbi:fimbria/pilus outer membrane usher protein [Paraburkholderia dinghuensis]|uniref:fimbria/pilus outer membrane usher protein n=1 Tax=Paraburkholderia dinghuensis TaxID=2305225 RepID=UPI001FEB972B|nr:fimbria/pilus outer membrane usher protein [Paraburkholderia dinghuensis]
MLSALSAFAPVMAQEAPHTERFDVANVEFATDFLAQGSSKTVDISRFEQGNPVEPGVHDVDVFLNQTWVGRKSIRFEAPNGSKAGNAVPVFDKAMLEQVGVAVLKLSPEVQGELTAGKSLRIEEVAGDGSFSFDFGDQRLQLSVPQAVMSRNARGWVSPESWDSGVTAGILGYDANVYHFGGNGTTSQTQAYVGLNAGFNVGGWRFRHQGAYQYNSTSGSQYQNIATFAQHDLTKLQSQLTLGDAFTTGELFDSVGFRGARIQTDDRMLPESLRGYAPTVRGVANTNANVTIRQNGNIIYETTVAPGPFVIDDLFPTGYGGDLQVTVLEADGRTQTFSVPYAAVPLSLRPGVNRYSAVAGQVRDNRVDGHPLFVQGTWQRGFTNMITGYAGATGAPGYAAGMVGGVLNTKFGAFGVDVTQAMTSMRDGTKYSGTSLRGTYSKLFSDTGTNFTLAAYRYSTGGYFNLVDAMALRENPRASVYRTKNQAQITLNQSLGERGGQLYATGSVVNYWNHQGSDINYSVGYNNNIGKVAFNLSASRQRSSTGQMSTLYFANFSIPFGGKNPMSVSTNFSHSSQGNTQVQSSLSGSLGVDNALSYGINAAHSAGGNSGSSTTGGANVAYRSPFATFSSSVSGGPGFAQGSVGVRGAVVAHPGGVTLSQPVSETISVIEAKDAEGARVLNAAGVRVDGRGYAVVPFMTPYSMNSVDIDPKGLSTDVELQTTSQQIAPRAGSVTMLKFETVSGRTAVIQARRANGEPLPFGASVLDETGKELGVVGQASRIVARGLQESGALTVKWGEDASAVCRIAYTLPVREKGRHAEMYQQIESTCEAPGVQAHAGAAGAANAKVAAPAAQQ